MKLGKLLAAGKSVKSQHVAVSYRSNKQVYLPKFGTEKNPFKAEAAPIEATAVEAAVTDVAPVVRPVPKEGSKSATARADYGVTAEAHAFKAIAPAPAPKAAKPAVAPAVATASVSAPAKAPKKTSDWVYKFNPASLFRGGHKAAAKPFAGSAKTIAATQAELSLDSVKVVHNDLSDVDVEVVPMKSRSSAPENQPAKKSWEFIGERLFGVEAS